MPAKDINLILSSSTTTIVSSKIDLHQSISSPTCLPSAKTVANSPCQIHGLTLLLLFHSDIKKDLERKFYLKLTKQKSILQGTLCWCLLCVTEEEKERKKKISGPLLVSLFSHFYFALSISPKQ